MKTFSVKIHTQTDCYETEILANKKEFVIEKVTENKWLGIPKGDKLTLVNTNHVESIEIKEIKKP
jgi:hypothetical protein